MDLKKEFEIKIKRIRAYMEEKKLDGVFLKRQDDFAWLSCGGRNYVGAGDMGNCGLLVTEKGHYAITNNIEAPRMVAEENIGELGFEVHKSFWHDDAFENATISSLVPSMNVAKDFGPESIAEDIKKLRMDLTEAEIDRYIEIGKDASDAMERAALSFKKGESEYSMASKIIANMEEFGLEMISCMVASDERISNYRHPLPTAKTADSIVQLGGNFRRKGLIVCMTRFLTFGPASEEIKKQYYDNQIIDCTYITSSRPGTPYVDVLNAGRMKYDELGYKDEFNKHHQGGPIGYAGRDYRVGFGTKGNIEKHQAFCWNPSITGTKSEDTCISEEGGITMITKPMHFPKVEITVNGVTLERPGIMEL